MSRIAFAWELGSSYGHISVLQPLARKLKQRGHDVVLIVRELHYAHNLIDHEIPVLQAPLWSSKMEGFAGPPLNYSEILMRSGYFRADGLSGLVAAWRALFTLHGSDLVVTDHAPTALLTARSMGLSAAAQGSGFYFPPRQTPLPNMRPWLNVPPGRLEQSDALVLSNMNQVLTQHQAKPLAAVGDLFEIAENFLCTFAELDHYASRELAKYWGAYCRLDLGESIAWPQGAGKRILVYLKPQSRDFSAVLNALSALGHRAIVCVPDIPEALRKQHESAQIIISDQPVKLDQLLRDCDLVISNAGHGMTAGMLMKGIPLLLLPLQLEQFLLGVRVAALGAGMAVNPEAPVPEYGAILQRLLNVPDYREKAQAFARKYADFDQDRQQENIVARIEEIAIGQRATI